MMSTQKTEHEFIFAIEDLRPVKSHITSDVLALFILKICRELCGPEFSPTAVEVPWSEGQYPASFKKLARAPLLCEAENYALRFSRAAVEVPLPSANAQLASYQDKLCNDYLHSLNENQHLSLRVKLRILQTLGNGEFSIDHIASGLNMSARTLQRKLQEEQTSFHRLRDEARKELVAEYLQNPELSATQITYMLGFSNLPSFSSAFKSWSDGLLLNVVRASDTIKPFNPLRRFSSEHEIQPPIFRHSRPRPALGRRLHRGLPPGAVNPGRRLVRNGLAVVRRFGVRHEVPDFPLRTRVRPRHRSTSAAGFKRGKLGPVVVAALSCSASCSPASPPLR